MGVTIDGTTYNVPVLKITRAAEFLDLYAERTQDGDLHRQLIGVYFNYVVSFGRTSDYTEYAALWAALTEAVPFHTVTVPDESGDYTFTAYFAGIKDQIRKATSGANYWEGLVVNMIAKAPAASA